MTDATAPLSPVSVRRLTVLAEFLEDFRARTGSDDDFVMGTWFEGPGDRGCGTAACAFGWATTLPGLRAEGLDRTDWGVPVFGDHAEHEAARRFFGLDQKTSLHLFGSTEYGRDETDYDWVNPTPKEVAARIREVIARTP